MDNFDRLQRLFPFVIMLYLMMSLAQLHAFQISRPAMPWKSADSTAAMAALFNLKRNIVQIGQSTRDIAFICGPANYALGCYASP